ncbi:S8 family serine peptidase [Bacillus sp. FJAT-49736]|uniref:S8 family serine peptidase n=1 Tax=Bacillus sp. FJAT-49736 TaxID=2833582 RepID=UPI001BC9D60A|nr:S8 family serine peptidase [Bacillus sp. FJAT-49736]MBS4175452.1 S8 family serine peptidase [Bacillus sp. FJAT-49736]
MLKRSFAILLILLLALSSAAFGAGSSHAVGLDKPNKGKPEKVQSNMDPNKDVRVFVEMTGEPGIEYAKQKGVKYNKLSKQERKSIENKALAEQSTVKGKMKDKKIKSKYINDVTTVVNGFSADIKYGDIDQIKSIDGVKSVQVVNEYKRPEEKPDMIYSKELVQAQEAWRNYGYKGEGMVVGIIDTGIDYDHKDMKLSDPAKEKLTQSKVNDLVADNGLPGKFYTDKVPYGYNYFDKNDVVKDLGAGASMHGMHVSGTVAANGDENNGGIKGIAPEAQLLALKVFSNDQSIKSTYGDIYVKAIDDAIKLGADVINMSLGSPSGFVDANSPEQQAVKRATDNGVVLSISAGNSSLFGDGYYYPLTSNPDYGVVGSPSVSNESISVASFENTNIQVDGLKYSIAGEAGSAPFLSAGQTHPNNVEQKTFEVLAAGLGGPNDFAGKDFSGKYALVQRGTYNFVDKAINAQKAGAAGVIIYNNQDGLVNMASDPSITIPQLFMLKNDGDKLRASLDSGKAVTITFDGGKTSMQNPDAGKMSSFSSWGIAPNLDFKPEITAPGGQIYSTLNDNKYGLMSGTSMAAPHVSGGSALVLERVDKDFGLKDSDRVQLAKNLLMNTAKPVVFDGNFVSPRRQGAGLMQINSALTTPVIVTDSKTNVAKVALKEIKNGKVTFQLSAKNLTNKPATYDLTINAQTDKPLQNGSDLINAPNLVGALDLGSYVDFKVNGKAKDQVVVPANKEVKINITMDAKAAEKYVASAYPNGFWLEGFIQLTDPTDTNPTLTVPYVGFDGSWDQAPIFDRPMWDENTYYGYTGVLTSLGGGDYGFLGEDVKTGDIDPAKIAISPNGDGVQDNALPLLSFMRNAKNVTVYVLDSKKHRVATVGTESDMRKDSYDNGNGSRYTLDPVFLWDGKIKGKTASEGQYYLQVEGVIDYSKAKPQTLELPVKVDVTKPSLNVKYDAASKNLTVNASDEKNGSGLSYWDVLVDGKSVTKNAYFSESDHQFNVGEIKGHQVTVVAYDNAGNSTVVPVK